MYHLHIYSQTYSLACSGTEDMRAICLLQELYHTMLTG